MDHFLRLAFPLAAAATLTGCVHMQIDETAPSLETLTLLRTQAVPQITLGEFKEVGGTSFARNINVRGSTLRAPGGGNFADFLKKSFQSELPAHMPPVQRLPSRALWRRAAQQKTWPKGTPLWVL